MPKPMTLRELTRLASFGEGEHLEFKRRVPDGPRIAREAIALANSGGGRLLLGVSDDGRVEGLQYAAEEAFALRHGLKRYCQPPLEYDTERIPIQDRRDVIVVTVPESRRKPHVLVDDVGGAEPGGDGVAYVRVGEMSVEASPEAVELMEAGEERNGVTFEFGEKEQLLMRYLDDYARITVAQYARLAGISEEDASATLLTLTKAELLNLQPGRREDHFTLALRDG